MGDDGLKDLLKRWAKWIEKIDGHSRSTTLARAMAGGLTTDGFGPTIPIGVEPDDPELQRVILAMANCEAVPKKSRYVTAMQLHYLLGPQKIEEILGKPSSTVRRWRKRGEDILRRELKTL